MVLYTAIVVLVSQTRTFTARDACGNTSTASRTVTWTADLTPPVNHCKWYYYIHLDVIQLLADINAALGTATATDAVALQLYHSSDGPVTAMVVPVISNKNIYCNRCLW